MMSILDLESFDENQSGDNSSCKDELEKLKSFYEEKIKFLKDEFDKNLKQQADESYQKGYQDAKNQIQQEIDQLKQQLEEEYNQQLETVAQELKHNFNNLLRQIEDKLQKENRAYKNAIYETIESSLKEIFQYLTLNSDCLSPVKDLISQIINDFEDLPPLKIKVNSATKEVLPELKIPVEIDESLENGDVIVKFEEFDIESKMKEKIQNVLDELKREIKQTS